MSQLSSVRSLTNTTFTLPKASDVMLALGTNFYAVNYEKADCLNLLNKDFILFVNKFMPEFVIQHNFEFVVSTIHDYQLKCLELSVHHDLRNRLADIVYGPLVYTCGCEHVSQALDCIAFDTSDSFEKDAFDTAVKNGEITEILAGLQGMVDHVAEVYRHFVTNLSKREWIFEGDSIIQGIHTINKADITKIADSIALEFNTHYSSTLQYVNEINMKRYFPVGLAQLKFILAADVQSLVNKGSAIEYADFCDFVAKYNLHFRYFN